MIAWAVRLFIAASIVALGLTMMASALLVELLTVIRNQSIRWVDVLVELADEDD